MQVGAYAAGVTQVTEAVGADRTAELVRAHYGSVSLRSSGAPAHLRVAQHQLPGVRLDRITFGMDAALDAEALDLVYVGRVRRGRVGYDYGRGEARYGPGDVFYCAGMSDDFSIDLHELEIEWAAIEPALLGQVADAEPASPGPVRLLDRRPHTAAAAQQWAHTYEFVADAISADPAAMDNTLVAAQAARLLAAVTLAAYPSTARAEPAAQERRDAHPDTLRRAVAFIEAHPRRDLTVADIAEAAHVTPRAVQLAFRRHLDTTPMAYLRRVRLDHAHRELSRARPGDTTVTAVAGRWGFLDASRFAATYRAAYGSSPSETLRG